jgi:hypothetical protein
MPIVIGTGGSSSSSAGLTSYLELRASVEAWLNRADLEDRVPDFIRLLEAELNRILRVPEMESSSSLSAEGGSDSLPTDFLEIIHVYRDADVDTELVPVPFSTLRRDYPTSTTGTPQVYAVHSDNIHVRPIPTSGEDGLTIFFYEKIPSIIPVADNPDPTNWVLDDHPDIYLFGTLVMAEAFIFNDERLPLWRAAFDSAIAQLQAQGTSKRYGGGPLFPRPIARPGALS